jgi:hypothetical protein
LAVCIFLVYNHFYSCTQLKICKSLLIFIGHSALCSYWKVFRFLLLCFCSFLFFLEN